MYDARITPQRAIRGALFAVSILLSVVLTSSPHAQYQVNYVTSTDTKPEVQAMRTVDSQFGLLDGTGWGSSARARRHAHETMMDATLEFYVDATSDVDDAARGGVLTLEVFELNSPLTGEVNRSDLRGAPMTRTVRTGESRYLRINVFEYAREALKQSRASCALVVGSLTGQRLGRFTLRHDGFDQRGVAARVTFVFVELGDRLPAER